ncbi:DsbA family protein [Rhizorhapis sp. SPR117]|uniref:DsbA family protein n=1 Tax=Rhizorhapis sp. SPR117 TaxID=2912611 RepID=UPI001F28D926|nr:DsbA family protein [Rhizorhapis sp. SPR117]
MIGFSRISILAGAALSLIMAPAVSAQKVDWAKRYSMSNIGGFIMGKPDAGTNLVEYISYTCSHCAAFTQKAAAPLHVNWVSKGTLNIEIRNAVRDRYDLTAALLARCGGPTKFFGNHDALMANFDNWMKQVVAYNDANKDKPPSASIDDTMDDIAASTGLYTLLQKRGFTPNQLKICLGDTGARDKILAMTKQAWGELKISGTPSFSVNGRLLADAHDWNSLEPALPPAAN